jgi:hypothetical protein
LKAQLREQIEELRHMTVGELRKKYIEVFGEETRSHHKQFLFRKIAWRIQANAEGGLSDRARHRALEIANTADLRVCPPKGFELGAPAKNSVSRKVMSADSRLPAPGGILIRKWKGDTVKVTVRDDGFEYNEQVYRSLSAIAREVTGTKWNGYTFFQLNGKGCKNGLNGKGCKNGRC